MYSPTVFVSLTVLLHLPNAASAADVNAKVGESILIHCKIIGTYVLPDWQKGTTISIAIQASSVINPAYSSRFKYDSDQKTLIVKPVQLNDTGSYTCSHNGGTNSPQTTTVEITEPIDCSNPCPIVYAVRTFFVLAIVVITAVIIFCCYILIRANKEYKKMKVMQEDNNATVYVILIIAAVLFITICAWFIWMQATVEDCEEMTKKECDINIGLLVVEIVVFVLGAIAIILAYICHKRIEMKIIRMKILRIITSAFPNHISREDLERILADVKLAIEQQLHELEKKKNIELKRHGYDRKSYFFFKTDQIMNANHRETIIQILTDAYPDILTVEDLRTRMGVEADIIKQELEKLKKEDLIISRHCGFVVKYHISKTELIRERILLFLGYAFPKDLTIDDLCKIIAGVEEVIIGQHLTELEKDCLIKSTQYGYVDNTSKTYPWKKRSVMKAMVEPQSGDTEQHHSDVSPRPRPQPALPPDERDKPGSEQSNKKTNNRLLSDQEYDQHRNNRLAPLNHTVMGESIKEKKKKKKTKTNNDNVKFDNDND